MLRILLSDAKVELVTEGTILPIHRVWSLQKLDVDPIESLARLFPCQLLLLFLYKASNTFVSLASLLDRFWLDRT